jgi:hypothetical protein
MEENIRIRAFFAPDDPEGCARFVEGHTKVLEMHGINKVTSSNEEWTNWPFVVVVVVEDMAGERMFGGARLHLYDGIHRLPIETAVFNMDSRIEEVIKSYADNGAAELCGLWNSIEVAGLGIGSLFPIRACVALTTQLEINSLFFLCSPLTVRFNKWVGSRVITEVGNHGTFYYPKLDLLATAVVLEDAYSVRSAHPREREKIYALRNDPLVVQREKSPFKNFYINVHYSLKLPILNKVKVG